MSDPRLIDMEPGGESTQYESIREFTITPAKQTGQLGVGEPHTKSELYTGTQPVQEGTASRDEYIMAQKLGMGQVDENKDLDFETKGDAAAAKARRQQGYGPGSNVGA
ncbi:uncharacterized protein N7477_008824 [Penicillium maclennaniae]|uniref:uncharacterized protein n=1 Tax=Penicillium maclennaniae TaxID=1343394 RepID=UPI00254211B6|nr:uncharacterized protein N7477_008824 [Penicillium maclennaniae]KAJ5666376.1 hypothetical protein N7477_008824 [Penicillium maclennaniae]